MENTVIGVYDSYTQAESAMNDLLAAGFTRSEVQLSPEADSADLAATRAAADKGESGIGHFFRSLFGLEEQREHHDIYSEAVRRGSCVLTVNAASDEQRDRATEIMNRHDPVDIDERATHWRSQGWSGYDASAPALSEDEIAQDRSAYAQQQAQARDASLNQQAGANRDIEDLAQDSTRAAQRGGVRIFQRIFEKPVQESVRRTDVEVEQLGADSARRADYAATATATADDSDYRRHWQSAYGTSGGRYEDYDAAYRYGSTMAGSSRFQNYQWQDVEPQLRSDWESHHPESTWDKVKDAVRYGAEKVSGRPH